MSFNRHMMYILEGTKVVPTDDMNAWGTMFSSPTRVVAKSSEMIDGERIEISTVFLGMDHNFGDGPPLVFESMVFGGEHQGECRRCATWDEAVLLHREMCQEYLGHPPIVEPSTTRSIILEN